MSMTFTKLFSSITESTVWCEPDSTRLCWITMLAMADRKGRVWASIPGLANRARVTIESCQIAIETFMSPDKFSRTSEHEGRRIIAIDGGWLLLNYEKYRAVKDEETVKESKRKYINAKRKAERINDRCVENVDQSRSLSIQAEAEAEAEAIKDKKICAKSPKFVKPTLEELKAHVAENNYHFNADVFYAHYESNGWKVGRNPVKSWQACCVKWNASNHAQPMPQNMQTRPRKELPNE